MFDYRDRRYCWDRPILTNLIQLAIALVYDLGLNKPPYQDQALILAHTIKGIPPPPGSERSANLEERRALLACFLLTSGYVYILIRGSLLY